MGNIILIAIIAILMVIGIIRDRNEKKREMEAKEQEEINKRTMPNGKLAPENDVFFDMTEEQLIELAGDSLDNKSCPNVMFLIDYANRIIVSDPEDEKQKQALIARLTHIKILTYHHTW